MAWQLICPPGCTEMFTGNASKSYSNSIRFSYTNSSVLKIPSTNEIHLMMNLSLRYRDSDFIRINSQNHQLRITTFNRNNGYLCIYQDNDKIADNFYFSREQATKMSISFNNNESNYMIIKENGNVVFEYKEKLLDGEPVTSITFFDPYGDFTSLNELYWLIVSSEKLPSSATVREIAPVVEETTWEQDEQGNYQTSDPEKTIKMKIPENCTEKGKVFLNSISYLKNVTGGGKVNAINIHTDGIDEDKNIEITEKPKNIGSFYVGETLFTTKE